MKKKPKTTNRKTGGRDFQPGNKAAIGHGRPNLPEDLKGIQEITAEVFRKKLTVFLNMRFADVEELADSPELSTLDALLVGVIVKAVRDGDDRRLNALLDRQIGKVKVEIESTHNFNSTMKNMTTIELISLGRKAVEFLEAEKAG